MHRRCRIGNPSGGHASEVLRRTTVPDIAAGDTSEHWPHYTIAAKTAGIQAVAGIPMLAECEAIGAVNLYDSQPRNWSAEDLRVATIFASIATGYLAHASAARQQQRTAEQLQRALNTRLIIEQAKGVLAAKRETTVGDAHTPQVRPRPQSPHPRCRPLRC